jgi:hypothetical protein
MTDPITAALAGTAIGGLVSLFEGKSKASTPTPEAAPAAPPPAAAPAQGPAPSSAVGNKSIGAGGTPSFLASAAAPLQQQTAAKTLLGQ